VSGRLFFWLADTRKISLFYPVKGAVAIPQSGVDIGKRRGEIGRLCLALEFLGDLTGLLGSARNCVDPPEDALASHIATSERIELQRLGDCFVRAPEPGKERSKMCASSNECGIQFKSLAALGNPVEGERDSVVKANTIPL
jgi:hypothetical protein